MEGLSKKKGEKERTHGHGQKCDDLGRSIGGGGKGHRSDKW